MAALSNVIPIDLGSVCLVNQDMSTVASLIQDLQVPFLGQTSGYVFPKVRCNLSSSLTSHQANAATPPPANPPGILRLSNAHQ